MLSRNIALFANGDAGIAVAEFLVANNESIRYLFLSGQYPEKDRKIEDIVLAKQSPKVIYGDIRKIPSAMDTSRSMSQLDAIITVYWPFILPFEICKLAPIGVNFHPALLPINRGWYPHVHNIIDGSPAGVTLHELSAGADEGNIWVQEEVEIKAWEDARDVYLKLQSKLVELFKKNWEDIVFGRISPTPQNESLAVYHGKKEIESFDEIDLNKTYSAEDFINLLRARTFGDKGFSYFYSEGKKINIKISLDLEKE